MGKTTLRTSRRFVIFAAWFCCFMGTVLAQNSLPVDLPNDAAVRAIEEDSFPADQLSKAYGGVRPRLSIFHVTVNGASKVLEINPLDRQTDDHISALARKLKFAQVRFNGQRLPWTSLIALCFLDHPNVALPCVPASTNPTAAPVRIRLLGKAKDMYLLPQPKGYQVNTVRIDFPSPKNRTDAQGLFRVHIVVNGSGEVSSVKVASAHPDMESAISDSVKKWKYLPLLWNGNPVEVEVDFEINYIYSGA